MPTLTPLVIAAAIKGFELQKLELDGKIAELRALLPGAKPLAAAQVSPANAPPAKKKRSMSAAGRKAIALGQQKRWAAKKLKVPPVVNNRGRMTPKKLKAIRAAQKKRWDLYYQTHPRPGAKKPLTRTARA